jgi:DNA-binding HxlR family transcriptional regulator
MTRRHSNPSALTAHTTASFRETLDRVGDKWSLLVIAMLEQRPIQRARFSELKRSIPGISQPIGKRTEENKPVTALLVLQ